MQLQIDILYMYLRKIGKNKPSYRDTSRDCNYGLVFPIPGFGIEDFVISGLRDFANNMVLTKHDGYLMTSFSDA